jgi:hypothetical protein
MGTALAVPVEVEGPQQPAVPAAQLRPANMHDQGLKLHSRSAQGHLNARSNASRRLLPNDSAAQAVL